VNFQVTINGNQQILENAKIVNMKRFEWGAAINPLRVTTIAEIKRGVDLIL
jgi:hypothetical protein